MNKGKILTLFFSVFFLTQITLTILPQSYIIRLTGSSMEPTSYENNFALCFETDKFSEGDIVSRNGIHHRIVEMNSTHVITKGDNNEYRDNPVRKDEVLCRTELLIPTGELLNIYKS